MKCAIRNSLVCIFVFFSSVFGADEKPQPPLRFSADRPVDVKHIALDLAVDLPKKQVAGTASIDLMALREVNLVRLNAVDFRVDSVTVARDGGPMGVTEFANTGEEIEVYFRDRALAKGASATIKITYAVSNPRSGLHFFGPSEAEPDVPYAMWSQGESEDNRYWIPCLDHPNEMQTTEIRATAVDGNEVVSNGRLVSRTKNPNGTETFHWLQDKPHVAYLITLVVGEFHVERETWRNRPVVYYVPKKRAADVKRSFGNTLKMLDFFSDYFGVEYPWDQYAQVCVEQFGGGMENTSATTLTPSTLHDERAHLDTSSDGLVAHELAHQWFGDLVTCKEWAHTWLNEGFATFGDALWVEKDLGQEEYEYEMHRNMQGAISGGKDHPIVHRRYEDAGEQFDARAYPKGASVLHMLRRKVGDDAFRTAVKRYLTEHRHQTVETSDLRAAFESETGRSLERFFYDWTERPGAPAVSVEVDWLEKEKLAKITVKQTQKDDAFHFPLVVECHVPDTEPIRKTLEVTEKEHRMFVTLPKQPHRVRVDPEAAVLMELTERKGRDLWKVQLQDDPSAALRIRAALHFGESKSDSDTELLGEAILKESFWGVGVEIAGALGKIGGEKARDVLLVGLKHQHPKVRRACAQQLDSFHGDKKVVQALEALVRSGDPSYRVEAAVLSSYGKLQPDNAVPLLTTVFGRDSHQEQIRSAALEALGWQAPAPAIPILLEWTKRGHPRECRSAAMSALGTLGQQAELSKTEVALIVDAIGDSMPGEHRRVQRAGIEALRKFGDRARPALPVIRALAANDPDHRVRQAAKTAAEKIAADAPEQVQVKELREELAKVRDEGKDLRKRLEKFEHDHD
ncbi:MAG: M1 family aminopeptidase [Planctomycetota bacterium]